jgi:two-component system sensor histidine kinase KdpD
MVPTRPAPPAPSKLWRYAASVTGVAAMTGAIALVPGADHAANVSLLYLLVVMGMAYRLGRDAAVLASVLAVLSFDWFFVEPRHTFTVNDPEEWLALAVFLATAMIISHLTTTLNRLASEAQRRERETAALAQASWAVASQVNHHHALAEVLRRLTDVIECDIVAIITRGDRGAPEVAAAYPDAEHLYLAVPDFLAGAALTSMNDILDSGEAPGWGAARQTAVYLALVIEKRMVGVLFLQLSQPRVVTAEERQVVESLCNHAAVALERNRLTQAEAQTQALAEADRLKTALLAMMSHDFRSPLTAIKTSVTGLLQDDVPWERATQRELLQGIDQETDRLNGMVGNILALSRLEAGAWRPQCELVTLAEIVGAALEAFSAEENRRITIELDSAPPEIWVDTVQIVQVLHNLLENALKYSPPGSSVHLSAAQRDGLLEIEVLDCGEGLAPGEEQLIFQRFYRAPRWRESSLPGAGIGLAICLGLVEAHGGGLTAANRIEGGAVFRMTLPLRGAIPPHTTPVDKTPGDGTKLP